MSEATGTTIQALSTLVLVLVTSWYAWRTHSMAEAAKASAAATEQAVEYSAMPWLDIGPSR